MKSCKKRVYVNLIIRVYLTVETRSVQSLKAEKSLRFPYLGSSSNIFKRNT